MPLADLALRPLAAAYDFIFPPLDGPDTADEFRLGNNLNLHDDDAEWSDGPWSFVTSRYAIALVLVAVLTNRILHICRPSRRSSRLTPATRIALRLPALLLLTRAILILAVVASSLAFDSDAIPNRLAPASIRAKWSNSERATPIGGWATRHFGSDHARARDAAALWAAFTSTAVAIVTEALVRSLDAEREEPPSFNLVGFAFFLHFHSFAADYPATKHVYLCVLLHLAEVWSVTLSKCTRTRTRPPLGSRLAITSVFGLTSTIHYLLTLGTTDYPFMQVFTRVPELCLICIIALTVSLHALTMALTEDTFQPERLVFNRGNLPSPRDDWSLALFKLGTACLESTRLTGLSREVAPLKTHPVPLVEMHPDGQVHLLDPHPSSQPGFGRQVKHFRFQDDLYDTSNSSGAFSYSRRMREAIRFVAQLVRTLRALLSMGARALGLPTPKVPAWVYPALRRLRLLWHGRNGEERRERRLAERRAAAAAAAAANATRHMSVQQQGLGKSGEQEQEDEDDGDSDGDGDWTVSSEAEAASEDETDVDQDSDEGDVYLALTRDALDIDEEQREEEHSASRVPLQQLMLAHLVHDTRLPPLTRSSYRQVSLSLSLSLPGPGPGLAAVDADLMAVIAARRTAIEAAQQGRGGDVESERRRLCVVCCVEERNVICWPCRCLCLCMECREHLANRPPHRNDHAPTASANANANARASTHLCPTCRTPVQAYSRLYIP